MVAALVFIIIILFVCLCSMHFNLRKAAEIRIHDLNELAKQDSELIELRHNMAEHQRLHAELNRILHPNGDGPKAPSLCDLVSFVLSDLRSAYKAGFIDAANSISALTVELRDLPSAKESADQMIDAVATRLDQVATARAYEYVASGTVRDYV